MRLQVLIIGLGQFGLSLAKTFSEKGAEVIGVDINKDLVNYASSYLDDVVCLDSTDEASLAKLSPKKRDIVICALGAKEPSILTTALLIGMGCRHVVGRATDKIHEKILKALGAHNVINPDLEYGKNFAFKVLFQHVLSSDAEDDVQLYNIDALPFMIGKTLIQLALPSKYGIVVATLRRNNKRIKLFANTKLEKGDVLGLVCDEEELEKMITEND